MRSFTCRQALCTFLELNETQRQRVVDLPNFPLLLPLRLAQKIQKGTLEDPILRQFLPLDEELREVPSFHADPVGDVAAQQTGGLLQKYRGRALLLVTGACAMNCRFCFRRAYSYPPRGLFTEELDWIARDTSLREIILSGGDPLSLSNRQLSTLIQALDAIPHLKRLRIHSRFPLGFPERLDAPFLALLRATRLQVYFVLHCNHPAELDVDVLAALARLPCPKLCQTVLLRGVNDSAETLKALCERLVDHGILPYYLHQLDRVVGAHHFEVTETEGRSLIEALEDELSGYAVPTYVRAQTGAAHKIRL